METANKWLYRGAARNHDMPDGQYLSLCVTDTGTGMTADVIAKAPDPFFITQALDAGTGLELSMIYGFAEQSGGRVRIYLEMRQGTTVCVSLPRYYGDTVADAGDTAQPPAPRADAAETILIVGDELTVRMLVAGVPDDLGYSVLEAGDSVSGFKMLFVTGYAENSVIGNGHLEPGMQVLTKPFAIDTLAARVRDLVGA